MLYDDAYYVGTEHKVVSTTKIWTGDLDFTEFWVGTQHQHMAHVYLTD